MLNLLVRIVVPFSRSGRSSTTCSGCMRGSAARSWWTVTTCIGVQRGHIVGDVVGDEVVGPARSVYASATSRRSKGTETLLG
jgi:hypothetical protein